MNPEMNLEMNPDLSTIGLQTVQHELTCPLCDNAEITTSWNPDVFNYGSGESMVKLIVDVPVRRCEGCDFEYLDDEAERLKHGAVCRHLGVLSPDEIRHLRKGFGMTRAKFAQVTGIGEASLNRWENGLTIQTHAYDRYLRLLAAHPSNIRHVEIIAHHATSSQSEVSSSNRFRVLKMTPNLLKERESFHLYKVA